MSRTHALSIAVFLSVTLAACGGASGGSNSGGTGGGGTTTPPPTTSANPCSTALLADTSEPASIGANWMLRQGYAEPFYRSNVATGDPLGSAKRVLATDDVGKFRLPAVNSLDVRLEKAFKIQRANLALDLDIFNVGNSATVLGRQYDLRLTGPTGFNKTLEIMNPRILRLGARFNF